MYFLYNVLQNVELITIKLTVLEMKCVFNQSLHFYTYSPDIHSILAKLRLHPKVDR